MEENLKVCPHCLSAIVSREGPHATFPHYINNEDKEITKCDWCEFTADEGGFDVLYELI